MINLLLIRRGILRLIQGRKTYREACDSQQIISPAQEYQALPAFFLEEDLAKIRGVPPDATYAGEISRLDVGTKRWEATIAYHFSDIDIVQGYLYKGAMKYPFVDAPESWFRQQQTTHISEALIASSVYTCRYFGHWITDALSLELAAEILAVSAITPAQKFYKHESEYRSLLGLDPLLVNRAKCKKLMILDDFAANQFKLDRFLQIRERIKSKIKPIHSRHGVMFLRKQSGNKRVLVNELEVADFLRSQGFIVIDSEMLTATDIMRQVLEAKIVIGVEGSQLTPAIYALSETGTILTLQPPDRFSTCHKEYTDCLGMHYGFLVGDQVEGGFQINISALSKLLDKINF